MEWKTLLNPTRIRKLIEPKASSSSVQDKSGRTEFDRDYDRLIFSTPFKRLQDKAQVFPLEEHDGVRTRLTHSLEVACVARDLANSICIRLVKKKRINEDQSRDISTIAAACALAHDLGNPPFGHAGEDAIKEWFKKDNTVFDGFSKCDGEVRAQLTQDFLCFDGNAQTQRLLSRLQVLSDLHGLNLTVATLAASCKYTVKSHEANKNHPFSYGKKHGYFASENQLMGRIFEATGTQGKRHPIAFIVEAADDIVNRAADLEDGVRKHRLDGKSLKAKLAAFLKDADIAARFKKVESELKKSHSDNATRLEGWAAVFRTWAVERMQVATRDVFLKHYDEIMSGGFKSDLISASREVKLYQTLKEIVQEHVFSDRTVTTRELMGRKIIHDLMDFYWNIWKEGKSGIRKEYPNPIPKHGHPGHKAYRLISPNYRHVYEKNIQDNNGAIPPAYFKMQLITDQISGMTDSFAVHTHKELFNG